METNLLAWSIQQFQIFLLILMRVAFILFMMPLLGTRSVPGLVKIGLSLIVSLLLLPVVRMHVPFFPTEPIHFVFFLMLEALTGFLLALSVRIVFGGIQLAGEFVSFKTGLGMAQTVDPQSGAQSTVITELYYFFALLVFMSIDGHHWFFKALVQSFRVLPPGGLVLHEALHRYFLDLSGRMFVVALKISAPILAILILAQVAMGIVARMVPQINILITSFPLTISLGFIFIGLSLDLLVPYLRSLFEESGRSMVTVILPLMAR